MRSKLGLLVLKMLVVAGLFGFLIVVEATAQGALPFVAGAVLSLLSLAGVGQLFLWSLRPARRRARRPAHVTVAATPAASTAARPQGATVVYFPDHPPTAC